MPQERELVRTQNKEIAQKDSSIEQRQENPTSSIKSRAVKRLLLAVTAVTLVACQVKDQVQPQLPAVLAETQATVLVIPPPTLTPFQPSEATATSIFPTVTLEQPIIEAALPLVTEVIPTIAEQVDLDPSFLDKNSYIYRNPTEIMFTQERATVVANEMLQRLITLGYVQDDGSPVVVKFETPKEGIGCETFAYKREIVCYNSEFLFQKPDASLVFHELTHLLQKGPEVSRNKELRAATNAYLLSGRDSRIYDRYLFIMKYPVNGEEFVFSASDFVKAMETQGVTEQQMLLYGFDSTVHSDVINSAMMRWVATLSDMSTNAPYLIDSTYQNGADFQFEMVGGIYGINPYNSDPSLTSDTQFDLCRANISTTSTLLENVGEHCVLIR